MTSAATRRKRKRRGARRSEAESYLPAALRRLDSAVASLCAPVAHSVDGSPAFAPSWLEQLSDARVSKRGIGNAHAIEPIIECWLDALMLLQTIHTTVSEWVPRDCGCVTVTARLAALQSRRWRPQDVKLIDSYSATLESWVKQIGALLNPETRLELPNPCPECGKRIAYKIDSCGERVRTASALVVTISGAECLACHARWRADQLTFLGRLLEYKAPEGVIE